MANPRLQTHKDELSLKNLSDEVVAGHIYSKHRDDDTVKIDVNNYISFLESIFANVDQIHQASFQVTYKMFYIFSCSGSGSISRLYMARCLS